MAKAVRAKKPTSMKGRPKGSKNNSTVFKEVIKAGFEEKFQKDFLDVLDTTIKEAKAGNMTAVKLLFDRALPVTKAVDIDAITSSGTKGISIHIEQLVASTGRAGDDIEDGIIIGEPNEA